MYLGSGGAAAANHLLGLEALVGDGRLDAGDERVLRLQANVDVFGNAHREVIAQTDALGELAEHPDGLMAVDLWLDGRLLQNDVIVAWAPVMRSSRSEGHEVRQHVVGDFAGVGEPYVIVDDKLHVLPRRRAHRWRSGCWCTGLPLHTMSAL